MVENRHRTMTFSQAKSFCSIKSKFWGGVEQESGLTRAKYCVNRVKTMVCINATVGFFLHPVSHQMVFKTKVRKTVRNENYVNSKAKYQFVCF